jgi:hypothetical protein
MAMPLDLHPKILLKVRERRSRAGPIRPADGNGVALGR